MLITSIYFFNVLRCRLKVFWNGHIEQNFEHLDPWGKSIVFPQEGTENELVRDVENFDNLVKNCESDFIIELAHILLSNLAESSSDLLHEANHDVPRLIHLVLVLLRKAEESGAARENTLLVARLQCIRNVFKEGRPFFRIVMPANFDNTPNKLLLNQAILTLKHLGDDIGAHVVLVCIGEDDISEASYRYFFGLLNTVVLPVVLDALAKLH